VVPRRDGLKKHPDPQGEFYAFNKILAITLFPFIFIFAVPVWILMAKKREPWAWTTILVYIMLCFSPSIIWLIPFFIFWIKPNNKAYYEKISIPCQVLERCGKPR
jgi:hypothetical protein